MESEPKTPSPSSPPETMAHAGTSTIKNPIFIQLSPAQLATLSTTSVIPVKILSSPTGSPIVVLPKTATSTGTSKLPTPSQQSTSSASSAASKTAVQSSTSSTSGTSSHHEDINLTTMAETAKLFSQKSPSKSVKRKKQPSVQEAPLRVKVRNYLFNASGQYKEAIAEEHNYCKPGGPSHPNPRVLAKPAKWLFMGHFHQNFSQKMAISKDDDDDELVNIMTVEEETKIPLLPPRRLPRVVLIDDEEEGEDTDFKLDSSITSNWTLQMSKLWTMADKILSDDRIERLTSVGRPNEQLLKRMLQEKTATKFRELFGSTFWDFKLVGWLHSSLIEHLSADFKQVYLESLQVLKHKIPTLIETFYRTEPEGKVQQPAAADPYRTDALFGTLNRFKLSKLPSNPVFIIVQTEPKPPTINLASRFSHWLSMLSLMGKVAQRIPIYSKKENQLVPDALSAIQAAVSKHIAYYAKLYKGRPLVLVGLHTGSLIAAHCALANADKIAAMVCLGFPLKTVSGSRGELDDPLMKLAVPTQFIIGEHSLATSLDEIETFRERLVMAENWLVVVGGADDRLKMSEVKMRLEGLTQSMVDRCVAEEVHGFLSSVIIGKLENEPCI